MSNASDFIIENGVLTKYVGPGGDVVIPECVREIGVHAFEDCRSLTSVIIPGSVSEIRSWAFSGCSKMKSVTIPNSVTVIGSYAFYVCGSLTSVVIPENVAEIGIWTFKGCRNLMTVTIPNSVISIGESAFEDCRNLATVTIPNSVAVIGNYAFKDCSNLTSVTIPESVSEIGSWAFAGCSSLSSAKICGDKAKKIDKSAFWGSKNTKFYLKSLSVLPTAMRKLAAIKFTEEIDSYDEESKKAYLKYLKSNAPKLIDDASGNPALLRVLCAENLIAAKFVPDYIEVVQRGGNAECVAMMLEYNATKITAKQKKRAADKKEADEDTVIDRKIMRQNKEGIDGFVFVMTGKLKFLKNRAELKRYLESKGAILANSVTSKVDYLIMNEDSMDSEKKKNAEALGVDVITECELFERTKDVFDLDEHNALRKYRGVGGNVTLPNGVNEIKSRAFSDCKSLISVTIPNGVTAIGYGAFWNCSSLTTVTIPDSVTSIGSSAFEYCSSLTTVTIPDSVTSIGSSAFEYCYNLVSVTIPDSVTEICDRAFRYCSRLRSLTIPNSITKIGGLVFSDCKSLQSVVLSEKIQKIGESLFSGCNNLEYVWIPDRVEEIGFWAFRGCKSLTSVRIPVDVAEINYCAFEDCESLTIHGITGSYAEQYANMKNIPFVAE